MCSEEGLSRDDIRRRFCDISKAYGVCHRIVQNFNEIYGKFVIIISINAFILILRVFSTTVISAKENKGWLTTQNISVLPLVFILMLAWLPPIGFDWLVNSPEVVPEPQENSR
ncbi:hypothetical protein JTB14_012113 [Gonioctena quinquepunctata]|nr:hypothetical protein JTB14_012113 [Gonioctena quinquepunctata]